MRLLPGCSLFMLLFLAWFYYLPGLEDTNPNETSATKTKAARSLDALIQDYACRVFAKPETGISYDDSVPSNLTGISFAAMSLRRDSLRNCGVENYKEFRIPTRVLVTSCVERLVLIYQNLGERSEELYPLPDFTYIAPVLGLLAYDAVGLSVTNVPELNITASLDPISIVFADVKNVRYGTKAKCARFDLQGGVYFSNVESGNTCSTMQHGHFSIVAEVKKSQLKIAALTFTGIVLCHLLCNKFYMKEHRTGYLLLMLVILAWFYHLPVLEAANLNESAPNTTIAARSQLDAHIQSEACRAFIHPRTGVSYSGTVPPNLTDIHYTGMRLRSGSFRRRGVDEYYEFHIPKGVLVTPYVKRLILVYQNLGNRSGEFYKLPRHKFLTPVLGLLAYDAANLSAKNLPKLNITASLDPISIVFPEVRKGKDVYTAKCVRFDSEGLVYFSKRESKDTCSTMQQGHFAIVAEKESRLPYTIFLILVVTGVLLYFCIRWFHKEYKAQPAMRANQRAE